MATNVTKDHIQFMEQQLKNAQIHLSCAEQRLANAKLKLAMKKEINPKKFGERPDLPDENSEIKNLRIKIAHYEFAIEAMKEKILREEGITVITSLPPRNRAEANEKLVKKQVEKATRKKTPHYHYKKKGNKNKGGNKNEQ